MSACGSPLPAVLQIQPDAMIAAVVGRWLQDLPLHLLDPVGTAAAGVAACRREAPDLLLVDTGLPDGDSIDLAEELVSSTPRKLRVVLFTARADEALLYRASISSSIDGVIWKSADAEAEMRSAIPGVLDGRKCLSRHFMNAVRELERRPDAFFKILSDREISLLPHFGAGRDNDEISVLTGLAASTVQTHRKRTMQKLGLHSIRELMGWTYQKGFVARMAATDGASGQRAPERPGSFRR